MKITLIHRLKAYRKASREIIIHTKEKVFLDKKKELNKYKCRSKEDE